MPALKALTPKEYSVQIVDELIDEVDLDTPADVVGIGAMGPQIARAYELADAFRARGRKVVLGGPWVTLAPKERSLAHADAVLSGEADTTWAECLRDLAQGRSRGVYEPTRFVSLGGHANIRGVGRGISDASFDVFSRIDYRDLALFRPTLWQKSAFYRVYFHWPVMFSRGCPHPCSYCAVQSFFERSYRTRSADAVLEDVRRIKALGGKNILFLDDNPIADHDAAKELFSRLIPERIKWTSQCTIEIARDPELLSLAARSGCVALSIGLESIDDDVLRGLKKGFNRASRFREDMGRLRDHGILVIALMMMGMDGQGTETFLHTVSFLLDEGVALVKFFTPAPYPGTPFHEEMKTKGRLREFDWGRYDYGSLLLEPQGMSADELRLGFDESYRRIYSLRGIAKRMLRVPRRNPIEHGAYVVANLKTWRFLKKNPSAWGTIS